MKQKNLSQKLKKKIKGQTEKPDKEIKNLEDTQKAILNLLEDLEKERENLQISKVKNEAMLASIGDGLVVVDMNMRVILINKAAEEATGWSSSEVLDKVWPEVIMLETEDGKKVPVNKSLVFSAIHSKKTTTTTTIYYYTRKNKTKFPVTITVSPFKIKNKLIGAIIVFRDFTREQEIDKKKAEFVSMISHQFGSPLVGIKWTIERIFKKENLTIGLQGYLQDIFISVKHLSDLVNNLLNASRFEEGKLTVFAEQIELVAFIKDYIVGCTPVLIKKGIFLTFEEYPKALNIITDPNILWNIIQSLVSNAIEYTPEGGRVRVFLKRKDGRFLFAVSDTGIGIPKKEEANIFEKFSRGSNAKLIKASGSGLGLYLAKQAVEVFGGKIWFESKKDKGTTFYVELPLKVKSKKGSKRLA